MVSRSAAGEQEPLFGVAALFNRSPRMLVFALNNPSEGFWATGTGDCASAVGGAAAVKVGKVWFRCEGSLFSRERQMLARTQSKPTRTSQIGVSVLSHSSPVLSNACLCLRQFACLLR